ncbi:hypothetical protein E4U16_006693 [Claviceps sp. LM84 group G4]|nr:hypothetical protein E4U33_000205 [Claviceps sp. LM78 group G4]KAG6070651.1 hypothetical protein E4U16_006693 [Claviceps sp. LM84 group G4]
MSDHGDIHELLRMLTSRKVPVMAAMGYVKTLQEQGLRSVQQIAQAPLSALEAAIPDSRVARSLYSACRLHIKSAPKRAAAEEAGEGATAPDAKRARLEPHKRDLDYGTMSADELETALGLPLERDEDAIRQTTIVTNRAPLVLAFAVEILRFTMPAQPPSSRLSLGQAVVSANSRSKAVNIGIDRRPPAACKEQIPDGQPKVSVLGRQVAVLKRGGYTWKSASEEAPSITTSATPTAAAQESVGKGKDVAVETGTRTWTASQKLSSKGSTFIAHTANLAAPSLRTSLLKSLMSDKPDLETATHNVWALRCSYGNSPLVQEASSDDGETGAGNFLLGIMREAHITNTLVILTRWYGGVMLGPDRWRLMRECVNDALSARRRTCTITGEEALWGLDLDNKTPSPTTIGMPIHRPEGARNYLLRSFASAALSDGSGGDGRREGKKTLVALQDEKQVNLGRLLGALRLLFESWSGVLSRVELDKRAWSWYVAVRPDVEAGPSGWGAKGELPLSKILDLRRREGGSAG